MNHITEHSPYPYLSKALSHLSYDNQFSIRHWQEWPDLKHNFEVSLYRILEEQAKRLSEEELEILIGGEDKEAFAIKNKHDIYQLSNFIEDIFDGCLHSFFAEDRDLEYSVSILESLSSNTIKERHFDHKHIVKECRSIDNYLEYYERKNTNYWLFSTLCKYCDNTTELDLLISYTPLLAYKLMKGFFYSCYTKRKYIEFNGCIYTEKMIELKLESIKRINHEY